MSSTTTDPIMLMPTDTLLERIHLLPDELVARDQWIVWRLELIDGDETKVPYQPHTPKRRARVNDAATWCSFAQTLDTFTAALGTERRFTGIGFLFTEDDPFVGVDLDDCVTGDVIHPEALKIVRGLGGYAEISPSQNGVKVWTCASLNLATTGKAAHDTPWGGAVEVYHRRRWFAVTGWRVDQ